ncbi:unnamed protein product [Lota lota]
MFFIQGAVVSCQDVLSNTVVELTVRPGENVTLYCDCKQLPLENIVWFRNCSHENQPTLTLNWKERHLGIFDYAENGSHFSHLNMMPNDSTNSYNLLIKNITDSHLGLYYCGTEKLNGTKRETNYVYKYGNIITRISFGAGDPGPAAPDCGQCWMLLAILCPSSALLLSLFSSLVVYLCCRKTVVKQSAKYVDDSNINSYICHSQDEDGLCYAAVDIPLRSERPKKKRVQTSEFSSYSAINTKRM